MLNLTAKRANEIHTKPITHTHSYQLELSKQRQWDPLRENLNQSLTLTHTHSLTQFTLTPLASLASLARFARSPHAHAPPPSSLTALQCPPRRPLLSSGASVTPRSHAQSHAHPRTSTHKSTHIHAQIHTLTPLASLASLARFARSPHAHAPPPSSLTALQCPPRRPLLSSGASGWRCV